MVDAMDSKSIVRKDVRVQVSPPAQSFVIEYSHGNA